MDLSTFLEPPVKYKEEFGEDAKFWFNIDLINWAYYSKSTRTAEDRANLLDAINGYRGFYNVQETAEEIITRFVGFPEDDFNALGKELVAKLK